MSDKIFEGKMFIFTAPSGAGKTTIVRHLLDKYNFLDFSISATTRNKRPHEQDKVDYYFMSVDEFKENVTNGAFIEWEEVYENQFYGTLKSEVERIWSNNKHLVFDIDVRGAQNIKSFFGDKCMSVFVRPPSVEVLIERLVNRNTETPESLQKRISKVRREMEYENTFDMVLVNDLLEVSFVEAEHIVETFIEGVA
ncbi:MAG TPA: guanylate kinase [Saprospiraceae bacterium]|nr:guanylate kinase [Saprospiraceae bacterium]